MTAPLKDIVHSIDIEAPRTTVWDVMTDAGSVPQWLGCMNYESLEPPELFVFSCCMPGTPKSTVSIRLDDLGGDITRATLTHSGWSQFPLVLPNLKTAAEAFRKAMS